MQSVVYGVRVGTGAAWRQVGDSRWGQNMWGGVGGLNGQGLALECVKICHGLLLHVLDRLLTLCPVNDVGGDSLLGRPGDDHRGDTHSLWRVLLGFPGRLLTGLELLEVWVIFCVVGEVGVEVLFAEECLAAELTLVLSDARVSLLVPLQAPCKYYRLKVAASDHVLTIAFSDPWAQMFEDM